MTAVATPTESQGGTLQQGQRRVLLQPPIGRGQKPSGGQFRIFRRFIRPGGERTLPIMTSPDRPAGDSPPFDRAPFLRATSVNGRTVAWAEAGDTAGRPIFLMHGTPGSRLILRHFDLGGHGLRVIATDRPGFGASDRLPGRAVAHVASDVAAIADAAGIRDFSVYGRSGGGPHALACAELLGPRVTAVGVAVGLAPPEMPGRFHRSHRAYAQASSGESRCFRRRVDGADVR